MNKLNPGVEPWTPNTFEEHTAKWRIGKFVVPMTITLSNNRMYFHFPYQKDLLTEVKESFEGRKWHGYEDPPKKAWSAPITHRNVFLVNWFEGHEPFARFDSYKNGTGLKLAGSRFPLYAHQVDLIQHALTVRWFIWAAEMGLGKTLGSFNVMEEAKARWGIWDWIWVGPLGAIRSVKAECKKWNVQVLPQFVTYDGLKKLVETWPKGKTAPQGVIFDESSRVKNEGANRSQAAKHLADSMRDDHGDDCFIGLLSGTPSPKSPADWWWQCEIACPGFLREGNIYDFRKRLAVVSKQEAFEGGGSFDKIVTWKDSIDKCEICGELKTHKLHDQRLDFMNAGDTHTFKPCKNEVAFLSERLKGLVVVKKKVDCLDLPEKRFERIYCQPSVDIINTARMIAQSGISTAVALVKLRELSDGFQMTETPIGKQVCQLCKGKKKRPEYSDNSEADALVPCERCNESGEELVFERRVVEFACPKDELIKDQLDLHEDVGRFVIYAGFTASIDRVTKLCKNAGWTTIRADGRGWAGTTPTGGVLPDADLLSIFQDQQEAYEKVCFIGQPGAAGMGLTLTASPTICFYSNDFNAENRMQAVDRGHRIGMDKERGGRIIDLIHLSTDEYVLDNLERKQDLQDMSMLGILKALGVGDGPVT